MTVRSPGEGRYAHLEREQRWLLETVPTSATDPVDIYDRYITGTRLRLRAADGVFKLGQKVPTSDDTVKITNIYLSAAEYEVFAALPAREVRKRRWRLEWRGYTLAVDEFTDRELVLGEVELASDQPYLPLPAFALRDVTLDPAYQGGSLAH